MKLLFSGRSASSGTSWLNGCLRDYTLTAFVGEPAKLGIGHKGP